MKSNVSLSTHVAVLPTGAEDTARVDMSMARIAATLTEDGATGAKTLFHGLVTNVMGPALAVIRGVTDMNGALSVGHDMRSKHSAAITKPHERNPQCKVFSLRPRSPRDRAGRMAGEHSQVGIDLWRPLRRVNEESSLSRQSNLIGASSSPDAESVYLRSDGSSDSSVHATKRTIPSRRDSYA